MHEFLLPLKIDMQSIPLQVSIVYELIVNEVETLLAAYVTQTKIHFSCDALISPITAGDNAHDEHSRHAKFFRISGNVADSVSNIRCIWLGGVNFCGDVICSCNNYDTAWLQHLNIIFAIVSDFACCSSKMPFNLDMLSARCQ